MNLTIVEGSPDELYEEVSPIVEECFSGIWTAADLQKLIEITHETRTFLVAYDGEKPIGYIYLVTDYVDDLDTTVATIQELGILPKYRAPSIIEQLLSKTIAVAKEKKAKVLEQMVSSLDQWTIPTLLQQQFKPSEIKADREISTLNEARLLVQNLKKNRKINVLVNQLIFESEGEFDVQFLETESELDELARNDPIAFSSIISVDQDNSESTLTELKNLDIEWDEIGITFEYDLED
ncbi:MAG: GNAT family N-acetyltransferase [Candidatus Heimdallarchaeota archaeon]|nr:GNAT family N-acetyltransferase [Candidatus Heimdallarchaeota archaeon]